MQLTEQRVLKDHGSRPQAWGTDGRPWSQTLGGSMARPRRTQELLTLAPVTL